MLVLIASIFIAASLLMEPAEAKSVVVPTAKNMTQELACGTSIYTNGARNLKNLTEVVNGDDALPGELPWQVKLTNTEGNTFRCGGVVLDSYHILTAAHCVYKCGSGARDVGVVLGAHELASPDSGHLYEIEQSKVHESYCSSRYRHDIALLRTKHPIGFVLTDDGYGSINAICLPHQPDMDYADGETFVVSGWGRTNFEPASSPESLQHLSLAHVDAQRCQQILTSRPEWNDELNYDSKLEVCAGGQKGEGHCRGDSGGPLARNVGGVYELVGLVSRSARCETEGIPGIYTRVDQHLDWIAENLGE